MNTSNPLHRSRLINFRVTPEEYERLREASTARGVACFSDFARETLLEGARRRPASAAGYAWRSPWMEFEQRLVELESRMEQVVEFVDHIGRRLEIALRPERRMVRNPGPGKSARNEEERA